MQERNSPRENGYRQFEHNWAGEMMFVLHIILTFKQRQTPKNE